MVLFDTHTHLLDEKFDELREKILLDLAIKDVRYIVECAADEADSVRAVALAEEHTAVFAAVGVHPHSASEYTEQTKNVLSVLAKHKKVVAIGEIGLDYHYDFSPRDVQKEVFEKQIRLALELDLPIVVHSREATQDTMKLLKKYPSVRGELHCFSGSADTAKELLDMGYYIAFGGALTFKNAKKPIEAAGVVPLERLLIETDCPYMTPVPYRGTTNKPEYVAIVAQKLAEIKQISVEQIAQATTQNAKDFFGIEDSI